MPAKKIVSPSKPRDQALLKQKVSPYLKTYSSSKKLKHMTRNTSTLVLKSDENLSSKHNTDCQLVQVPKVTHEDNIEFDIYHMKPNLGDSIELDL